MPPDDSNTHPYLKHLNSLHAQLLEMMRMIDTDLPTDWFADKEGHELAELEHARWWSVMDMVRDAIAGEIIDTASVVTEVKDAVFDELLSKMQQLKKDLATANRKVAELESTKTRN